MLDFAWNMWNTYYKIVFMITGGCSPSGASLFLLAPFWMPSKKFSINSFGFGGKSSSSGSYFSNATLIIFGAQTICEYQACFGINELERIVYLTTFHAFIVNGCDSREFCVCSWIWTVRISVSICCCTYYRMESVKSEFGWVYVIRLMYRKEQQQFFD